MKAKELQFKLKKVYYWCRYSHERAFLRYLRSMSYVQKTSMRYLNAEEMLQLTKLILKIVDVMKRENVDILNKLKNQMSKSEKGRVLFIDKNGVLK